MSTENNHRSAADLAALKFRGPVAFCDGRNGMARQDFQCVDEPRFGYFWRRETIADAGRQAFMVDGTEVADLEEAARQLALPVADDSPDSLRRRSIDEFKASPSLNYGATRALSEARCNADGGPFGMIRAWMHRAGDAWHGAINRVSEHARSTGGEWPRWLYNCKHAAHETYRGMYLFQADRKADTGLMCAFGTSCRECPILKQIETSMIDDRTRAVFPREIEDSDIDAAKVFTCIGHTLQKNKDFLDGAIFSTKADREETHFLY